MDYRVEKVFVRLSDDLPGIDDPNKDIDATELCWVDSSGINANTVGVTPLPEFWVAGFKTYSEDEQWFPAADGLKTVNALLRHYRGIVASGNDALGRTIDVIADKIATLEPLESILLEAELHGVQFCLVATE